MLKNKLNNLALALSCSIVIGGVCLINTVEAGSLTFQSAVAEYKAGKYQSALAMFKSFAQASPNNALVHYYLALCHHNLNHVEQARQEYNFVIAKGEPSYKALAEKGLSRLGGSASVSASSPSSAGSASQVPAAQRAKKVIDFSAEWCGPCKQFAPVFEEVKKNSKYRDIQFESVDIDHNEALAEKYNVESIPTVVILSSSGAVLYNDHPPRDIAGFEELVSRFH